MNQETGHKANTLTSPSLSSPIFYSSPCCQLYVFWCFTRPFNTTLVRAAHVYSTLASRDQFVTALHLTFVLTHFSYTKELKYSRRSSIEGLGNLLLCDYGSVTNTVRRVFVFLQFVFTNKTNRGPGLRVRDAVMLIFPQALLRFTVSICFSCAKPKKQKRRQGGEKRFFGF